MSVSSGLKVTSAAVVANCLAIVSSIVSNRLFPVFSWIRPQHAESFVNSMLCALRKFPSSSLSVVLSVESLSILLSTSRSLPG